jgi:hypothetical protein
VINLFNFFPEPNAEELPFFVSGYLIQLQADEKSLDGPQRDLRRGGD